VSTIVLYGVALGLFAFSFFKDKEKTKKALRKALAVMENIMPEFLVVILLVGILLAFMDPQLISSLIGVDSGMWGGVCRLGCRFNHPYSRFRRLSHGLDVASRWRRLYADRCFRVQSDDGGCGHFPS